jgi:hypothetical protein
MLGTAGPSVSECHGYAAHIIRPALDDVRRHAGGPYRRFLKENIGLLKNLAFSRGMNVNISTLTSEQLDEVLDVIFEKFLGDRSLLGTPDTCLAMARQLAAIGVDEIACLLDFGPAADAIVETLPQWCTGQPSNRTKRKRQTP